MIKHFIVMLALTVLVIVTVPFLHQGLGTFLQIHAFIIEMLSKVVNGGHLGVLIKELIAIFVLPLAIGGILGFVYWVFKRTTMPYLLHVIWIVWVILTTAIVCQ